MNLFRFVTGLMTASIHWIRRELNLFRFVTGLITAYMALLTAVGCFAMIESFYRGSLPEAALGLIWFVGFLFATLIIGAICWIEGEGM